MRDYLVDFFHTFDYADVDADYLLGVYDSIVERQDTRVTWNEAITIYKKQTDCDFGIIISLAEEVAERLDIHAYTADLLIFICLSKRLKELYIERGIALKIFHDSMLDLKYKLDECKAVKGVIGTFVAKWFGRFFNLERVTLGRLEFEVNSFGFNYEKNGRVLTPESRVINVHIPRTLTPLTPESCDNAFAQAKEYFKNEVEECCPFICNSWMLYPGNRDILPDDTNVYRFMSRFDIYDFGDNPNHVDLWRIFDTDETNPELLPANTRMRRAYINHLKNGCTIGWGRGVFFLE